MSPNSPLLETIEHELKSAVVHPGLIRVRDVAELLQQPQAELERELRSKRVPIRRHAGQPAVDWERLTIFLGKQRFGRLTKAVADRNYDLDHFTWTVASFPELVSQWDVKRNRSLKPSDITFCSTTKEVWWRCPVSNDHAWQSVPGKRLLYNHGNFRIANCPFCSHHRSTPANSLAKKCPAIAKQWDIERNSPLGPSDVAPMSHKKVWWKCAKGHVWNEPVRHRTSTEGKCPFCAGTRLSPDNSLAAKDPNLAAEWHSTRNGRLTPADLTNRSDRDVWWQCPAGPDHAWQASPAYRVQSPSCPYCSNRRASRDNSLAQTYPAVAKQWHPTKNGKLRPSEVVAGSRKKVWWKCPWGSDHEWECRVVNRTRYNTGCPYCSGKFVSKTNSLARLYASVAKQWHPSRNGALKPSEVIATSTKTAWWMCDRGHEWKTRIRLRITLKGRNCPKCGADG
jgi:hypothetical protein